MSLHVSTQLHRKTSSPETHFHKKKLSTCFAMNVAHYVGKNTFFLATLMMKMLFVRRIITTIYFKKADEKCSTASFVLLMKN